MKSLPVRIVSALVALFVFIAASYWGGANALFVVSFVLCAVGLREYYNIAFKKLNLPPVFSQVYYLVAVFFFMELVIPHPQSELYWPVIITFIVGGSLIASKNNPDREQQVDTQTLLTGITLGLLGFLYGALLPSFALKLLRLENGLSWFVFLLLVVFAGDVFAYFAGNFFGKHKLMPNISPNKTVQGAIGGIFGSALAGVTYAHYFLPSHSLATIAATSTLAAVLAQMGDLFESLVKRVADVKDSGRVMPGHGGILDRLDGVYFAAPLVYAVSQWPVLPI